MPDRQTIENKRIKREIQAKREKNRRARRRRNIRLAIICTIFSIITIIGAIYIILNSISDKEEIREEGIKAFNKGDYSAALSKFDESLNEKQWFSGKMDFDTRLYVAACYMRTGEYEEASKKYQDMLKNYKSSDSTIEKDSLVGYKLLADALNETSNGKTGDNIIKQLKKELDDGNISVSLYIGTLYQQNEDYENMIKYYDIYTDEYGMNTYIAYQISSYYLDNNNDEEAKSIINKGLNASDELYIDKLLYNDIIITERSKDYEGALSKAKSLVDKYPKDEIYQKEYDFLYSRVNVNPNPVHTEGDADVTD